jgi:hypothetical protein
MADTAPQSAASHARWRPSYHFITGPILLANVINAAVQLRHGIRWDTVFPVLLAVALVLLYFHARLMALSVQDRVIRLEERLRLRELLPAALQPRIAEFTVPQLVGLRFASDAELPALAERVLAEGITTKKEIVAMIRTWRPDHQRA